MSACGVTSNQGSFSLRLDRFTGRARQTRQDHLQSPPIESAVALEHLKDCRLHPTVRVLDVDSSLDVIRIEAVVLALTDVCVREVLPEGSEVALFDEEAALGVFGDAGVTAESELPPDRNRRGDLETYDEARFFTVTTDRIEGIRTFLERCQDALFGVQYEYVQSSPDAETVPVDLEAATEGASRSDSSADERGDQAGESATGETPDKPAAPETATALGSDSGLYARYGLDYPDIEDPSLEAALHGLSPSALPSPLPTSMDDIAGPGVDLDDETVLERAMDSKSGDVI